MNSIFDKETEDYSVKTMAVRVLQTFSKRIDGANSFFFKFLLKTLTNQAAFSTGYLGLTAIS